MGKYLDVFTSFLFLIALFQCCSAAGGENPTDNPTAAYLTVVISKYVHYSCSCSYSILKGLSCTSKPKLKNLLHKLMSTNFLLFFHSQLLYRITSRDSTSPEESTVRKWIDCLNESLKCGLRYSESLARKLINWAIHIRRQIKNKSGRKRSNFLQLDWTLESDSFVASSASSADTPGSEVKKLSEKVKTLQNQLQSSSQVLQTVQNITPQRPTQGY